MTPATQPDQKTLEQVVEQALALARASGATAAEAGVGVSTGLSVTVRLGEVETLEYQRDRSLGVTVYAGHRKGSASTANLSPAAVEETVAKALSIASFTADDEYAGLPDAERMADRLPDLDLSHPWALEAPAAVELARRCEAAGLGFDDRIRNSEGASISTHRKLRVFGNSHGFIGGYPSTSHSVSCVVVGQDGGDMQRDYWYSAARDWRGLEDVESVGRKAAEKAVQRLGAGKLSTRKAPVLFAPELARGLIGHFTGAIGGAAQYRRSSFLLDAQGGQVFPDWMSLAERPHLPGALGSAPFDSEGVATRDRELVVNGVLGGYLLDSYSARKLGLVTTGNAGGVHNLVVQGRMLDPKSLLRQLGTGLLVTEMMGQGVNAVTGDYSRGASGFWVENGEIARPVHEITVAGNLREMFLGIAALGDDVDLRGAIHSGSLLIAEMTIAATEARGRSPCQGERPLASVAGCRAASSRRVMPAIRSRMPASTEFATSSATGSVRARHSSQVSYWRSSRTAFSTSASWMPSRSRAGITSSSSVSVRSPARSSERVTLASAEPGISRSSASARSSQGCSPATNLRAISSITVNASRSRSALVRRTCPWPTRR